MQLGSRQRLTDGVGELFRAGMIHGTVTGVAQEDGVGVDRGTSDCDTERGAIGACVCTAPSSRSERRSSAKCICHSNGRRALALEHVAIPIDAHEVALVRL